MAAPNVPDSTKAPRHLWVVGVVGLLFAAVGALDYYMTETRNVEYMAGFTPEQLEFFYGLPAWVVSSWAVAVWGSVVGCLLLLARRQFAVTVLGMSLVATLVTTVHNFGMSNGLEIMGSAQSLFFAGLILLFALGLWLYARAMRTAGVLR